MFFTFALIHTETGHIELAKLNTVLREKGKTQGSFRPDASAAATQLLEEKPLKVSSIFLPNFVKICLIDRDPPFSERSVELKIFCRNFKDLGFSLKFEIWPHAP